MTRRSAPAAPNLLFIWTDEQRADTMAAYGNHFVRSPNLNRLAASSFIFDNAYCCQPVCTPSRASILSGHWPHRHGCIANNIPLPQSSPTIAERTSDRFRKAYFGKWHLGDEVVAQRGFTDWLSIEDAAYRKFYSKKEYLQLRSDYHHYLWRHGFPPDQEMDGTMLYSRRMASLLAERHTKAAFLGRESARWIHDRAGEKQPWLLSVCFLEPHMPFQSPLNDLHDPDEIPVGPAFASTPASDQANKKRGYAAMFEAEGFEGRPLKTEADWRRMRANYYGLVSLVDSAVGEMLDALQRSGQAENTIVVFTSDHGEMMGDHACLTKALNYEESIRVPLLLRVPWLNRGQCHIPGRISQIDLLPTLLELMGEDIPSDLDGVSRAEVLQPGGSLEENEVVVEWISSPPNDEGDGNWRTLLSADGWKLSLSDREEGELFDLNGDPHELHNLHSQPEHRGRIDEMTARLRAWQKSHRDELPI